MKFTQGEIENLECPVGKKDALVFDDEQRGLGVRMTKGAKKGSMAGKSYLVQYRLAGRKQRVPVGACSAISLKSAREAARALLGDVAKGRNPAGERKQAVREAKEKAAEEALTLDVLIDKWEERHLADKRPGYAAEATRALRFAFKKHVKAPAATLTPKAAKAILNAIADDGKKATARLTGAYGRACYGWAIGKDLLSENPFSGIKLDSVASRERVLSDDELTAVWNATKGPGSYNAIVRLLTLTGARREEVSGMTWDEVAPDLTTWTIPAESSQKWRRAHRSALRASAGDHRGGAPRGEGRQEGRRQVRACLSGPGRRVQWLQQVQSDSGRGQRRHGLATSRPSPHAGDRPSTTRRPARSDRGGSESRIG